MARATAKSTSNYTPCLETAAQEKSGMTSASSHRMHHPTCRQFVGPLNLKKYGPRRLYRLHSRDDKIAADPKALDLPGPCPVETLEPPSAPQGLTRPNLTAVMGLLTPNPLNPKPPVPKPLIPNSGAAPTSRSTAEPAETLQTQTPRKRFHRTQTRNVPPRTEIHTLLRML